MISNFELLQQRCKKLKLKERLRYLAAILVLGGAAAFLLFPIDKQAQVSTPQLIIAQSPTPKSVQKIPPVTVIQTAVKPESPQEAATEPLEKSEEKERSYTLQVDSSYLQQLERPKAKTAEPVGVPPQKRVQTPPAAEVQTLQPSIVTPPIQAEAVTVETPVAAKPAQKPAIHMELTSNTLENILDEYNDKPTYQRALNIADIYYDKKDYDQCAVWAKKANLIQKDDAAAWIMFARAEYAKGKKDKAVRILELFLNNKNSVEAESMLMTWRQEG